MFIGDLARQHVAWSTGEAGPSVDGPGAKPWLDTFHCQSLTTIRANAQRLNTKSVMCLIFRKAFLAKVSGTFPLESPDLCGDLRCREDPFLVSAASEAGPACHFTQQPTIALLALLISIIEDRIQGRSFLGSRTAVFIGLVACTALVCTGVRFTYSPLSPLISI